MPLALIPLLLAEQAAASAWHLGGSGVKDLLTKDAVGRLLVLLYNDYGETSGLTKRQFYNLADDADLRVELELVVRGRRSSSDDDIGRLAGLLAPHIVSDSPQHDLQRGIAAAAIAVAPFALKDPQDVARYLVARVEELELILAELQETGTALLDGQELLREQGDANTARLLDAIQAMAPTQREVVRHVRSDWGPDGSEKALQRLGEVDAALLDRLRAAIGTPPSLDGLISLIRESPGWLRGGPVELFAATARLAEQFSDWSLASSRWEQGAQAAHTDEEGADLLIRAAIAAGVAHDEGRYQELPQRGKGSQSIRPATDPRTDL